MVEIFNIVMVKIWMLNNAEMLLKACNGFEIHVKLFSNMFKYKLVEMTADQPMHLNLLDMRV